jgi:enamine deaminase RidA (YjgF/YER057c/UK114 family)
MTADPAQRLRELGITLPPAPPIAGAFVQTMTTGDLVFTSGQIAVDGDNGLLATGKVGTEDVDTETATACARQCALNVLAQLAQALGGLERITRVVKLTVFVASAPGFTQQHVVANGPPSFSPTSSARQELTAAPRSAWRRFRSTAPSKSRRRWKCAEIAAGVGSVLYHAPTRIADGPLCGDQEPTLPYNQLVVR